MTDSTDSVASGGITGFRIADGGGGGSKTGFSGAKLASGAEAVIGGGWYFAVENGNGRPSAVVFTFGLDATGAVADDCCIGNATRLLRLVRGFAVAGTDAVADGIGGGSFHPGS